MFLELKLAVRNFFMMGVFFYFCDYIKFEQLKHDKKAYGYG